MLMIIFKYAGPVIVSAILLVAIIIYLHRSFNRIDETMSKNPDIKNINFMKKVTISGALLLGLHFAYKWFDRSSQKLIDEIKEEKKKT